MTGTTEPALITSSHLTELHQRRNEYIVAIWWLTTEFPASEVCPTPLKAQQSHSVPSLSHLGICMMRTAGSGPLSVPRLGSHFHVRTNGNHDHIWLAAVSPDSNHGSLQRSWRNDDKG